MPTSSQYLILQKKIHGVSVSGRSSQRLFKEEAKFSVASVYNLSGCLPLSVSSVADHAAINILGRESAQLFKYHSLPRGYTSILSLNKLNGVLQWQALGGSAGGLSTISPRASESMIQTRSHNELSESLSDEIHKRPKSAFPRSTSKTYVDPHIFENLIKLGFSRSALAKREDCVFDSTSTRRAVSSKLRGTGSLNETNLRRQKPESEDSDTHLDENAGDVRPDNAEFADDVSELSCDNVTSYEDFNRIKPSMHMRSDIPEPRPRAAIFSFRDNEYSSHAEVKYLIETQIGVKVKTIQFDPLNVRVVKPGVHSRWIVDFFSDWDLHQALKIGLTVGKDKLIFFKHDEIAKREVSSFKYFMTVLEAKKKLKSKAKSSHSPYQAKRATKSEK